MLKKILLMTLFLSFCSFASEVPIKATVSYNEASARIEAFKNLEKKLDKDIFKDFLKDKNRKENLEYMEKKVFTVENKRQLCPFYLNNTLFSYVVNYFDKPDYNFYYNIFGNLIKVEISTGENYPKKTIGYSRYGNLVNVAFEVQQNEQFVYDKSGKLIARWTDDKISGDNKVNKLLNKYGFKRGMP